VIATLALLELHQEKAAAAAGITATAPDGRLRSGAPGPSACQRLLERHREMDLTATHKHGGLIPPMIVRDGVPA
jgi:hypothetical protein